jgi:hypothetical protein
LLQELFAARIERVVARGQQAWRDLTGNGGAGRIVLRSAGKDVELHVGRVDGRETYVRFGSSFDVYAVKQRLQFFLEQPREYWLLLRVFPTDVSPLDVVFFEVTLPELDGLSAAERSLQLIKDGDAGLERWRATDGTPIDREEAVAIVGAAVDMVAAGFSQRSPEQSARRAGLRFVLADGREYSATISGQGPYVVTPKGADLPSRGYGSLSYLVDEARLRRMIVPR